MTSSYPQESKFPRDAIGWHVHDVICTMHMYTVCNANACKHPKATFLQFFFVELLKLYTTKSEQVVISNDDLVTHRAAKVNFVYTCVPVAMGLRHINSKHINCSMKEYQEEEEEGMVEQCWDRCSY